MKTIEPYLFASGRADEMIAYYTQALDAEVSMRMTFAEGPQSDHPMPPGWKDKVMHASLMIGDRQLMISDGDTDRHAQFDGFRLSLTSSDEAWVRRAFEVLSAGGSVQMPLSPTFWSPAFGMVTDKFGIGWMVSLAQ